MKVLFVFDGLGKKIVAAYWEDGGHVHGEVHSDKGNFKKHFHEKKMKDVKHQLVSTHTGSHEVEVDDLRKAINLLGKSSELAYKLR